MLTQSRKHIIKKTFEALQGVKKAVVHLYNSTSLAQREQAFKKEKPEIIKIATDGAALMKEYAAKHPETKFSFEYSPESFTGTEVEFAAEICNAVIDIWEPTPDNKVIIKFRREQWRCPCHMSMLHRLNICVQTSTTGKT